MSRKFFAMVLYIVLSIFSLGFVRNSVYSIVPNQTNLHYGDSVSFMATYPKKASIKVGKQQLINPGIQLDCYQNNTRIYSIHGMIISKKNNKDGTFTGITNPLRLGGTTNNFSWTSGGATCYINLYYFSGREMTYHFLAQTSFVVLD